MDTNQINDATPATTASASSELPTSGDAGAQISRAQPWFDKIYDGTWFSEHMWVAVCLEICVLFLISLIVFFAVRSYIYKAVIATIKKTKNTWDDAFLEAKVFSRISLLAPLLFINYIIQFLPAIHAHPQIVYGIQSISTALMVLSGMLACLSLTNAVNNIYVKRENAHKHPIKGYLQLVNIFICAIGAIFIIAILLDRSPWVFISGVGAMTAVLMLIFKDTILSVVASVQLSSNKMVQVGDWIEMPQYGADGDVIDIALHTVKIQNWDKTITTIPTHKLIETSFKNWRGMSESGGRRIKRSVSIDMSTIHFLSIEEIENLRQFEILTDYLDGKRQEIDSFNESAIKNKTFEPNKRRLTNIGTLRHYVKAYLRDKPYIHKDMTFLIRQLAPSETGIPLEIYIFSNNTNWIEYEDIQGDIFDHILAILPEFGLKAFQNPAGSDFANLNH